MAFTDFVVDASGGTDQASEDGSINEPWQTIQYAIDNLILGSDGSGLNLKSNAIHQLSATLDWTDFITNNTNTGNSSMLLTRGFTTTLKDGGVGVIDGDGNQIINNPNGTEPDSYLGFSNLKLQDYGANPAIELYRLAGGSRLHFDGGGIGQALEFGQAIPLQDCIFENITDLGDAQNPLFNSIIKITGSNTYTGNHNQACGCIFDFSGTTGACKIQNSANHNMRFANNTCLGNDVTNTDGIRIINASRNGMKISRNYFENFDFAIEDTNGAAMMDVVDNAFYSNATNINGTALKLYGDMNHVLGSRGINDDYTPTSALTSLTMNYDSFQGYNWMNYIGAVCPAAAGGSTVIVIDD